MTTNHDGERPEDGWGEESSLGWYFDLPNGAWERQEQKNRELRDRLRIQAKEQPSGKASAFTPVDQAPLGSDAEPLRRALPADLRTEVRAVDEPARRLKRAPVATAFGDFDDEVTDEPAPLVLNRHRSQSPAVPEIEDESATTFFGFSEDAEAEDIRPRDAASYPPAPDATLNGESEPGAFADWDIPDDDYGPSTDTALAAFDTQVAPPSEETGEHEWAVAGESAIEAPRDNADTPALESASRWDEMLAAEGDGGSIVERMREWATAVQPDETVEAANNPVTTDIDIPVESTAVAADPVLPVASVAAPETLDIPEWAADLIDDDTQADDADEQVAPKSGLLARLLGRKQQRAAELAPVPALVSGGDDEWSIDEGSDTAWIAETMAEAAAPSPTADANANANAEGEVKAEGVDEKPSGPDAEADDEVLAASAALVRRLHVELPGEEQATGMNERPTLPGDDDAHLPFEGEQPRAADPPPPPSESIDDDDPWSEFLAARDGGTAMPHAAGSGDAEEPFPFADGSSGSNSGSSAVPVEPSDTDTAGLDLDWFDQPGTPGSEDDTVENTFAEALLTESNPANPTRVPNDDDLSWDAIVDASGVEGDSYEPSLPPGIHGRGHAGRSMDNDARWANPPIPFDAGGAMPQPPAPIENTEQLEPVRDEPAWIADGDEDDIVLRAFEEHAAEADLSSDDDQHEWVEDRAAARPDLRDLLGDDHEALIGAPTIFAATVSNDRRGWAPQRTIQVDDADDEPQIGTPAVSGDRTPPPLAPWEMPFPGDDGFARSAQPGEQRRPWIRELIETGLLAILVFLAVRASFQNFRVDGQSMFPTLDNGQYIIVNKLSYSQIDMDRMSDFVPFIEAAQGEERYVFGGPDRGDIIVFASPRDPSEDLIKRVIGLPNETIEIRNGRVYINDLLLEEPYLDEVWAGDKPKVLIPPGEYFVMGDNRNNSQDSRSSQVGLVPESLIIGKAAFSFWPSNHFGLVPNGGGELSEEPVLTTQHIDD